MIPAILLCVLVLCIWIRYESKKSDNLEKKDSKAFWDQEHEADFTRKKDISNLDYISIPLETFPFGLAGSASVLPSGSDDTRDISTDNNTTSLTPASEQLAAPSPQPMSEQDRLRLRIDGYEATIRELSQKKILNLTGRSNTELKLTYGAANLDELSCYDQNYTLLVRTLYQWAEALTELGLTEQAKPLLEFGILCHTDVSGNFLLLARLYRAEQNVSALDQLITQANELNSLTKTALLEKLQSERNLMSIPSSDH